jgi:hypothetical protein
MMRFRPGTRVQYRDGVIYRVMPDGSHRREDGGKAGKAARKRQKKERRVERSQVKGKP